MSDQSLLIMKDGSKWLPATSKDEVECASCDNKVDTPEEVLSYPWGKCPECGNPWTGSEKRSTLIQVAMPQGISGGAG